MCVALLVGCSINPVTGQRELVLMSPEREAQVGKQAAQDVESQIGLVDSPQLTQYVASVGERLARFSPRQDVPYKFYVADMPEPNAFALPGGYIYISRGLLAIANSESELANVMGHEIGHVAARHSAQRETRAAGVGLLSMIGTIAAGALGGAQAAQSVAQIGQVAGAGLIASYGRDQERQSDEIGQKLTAQSGWDPGAMSDFFTTLQRETELRTGGPRRPSFLDSHPLSSERAATSKQRAQALQRAPGAPIAGSRGEFYGLVEGLMVGPDPAEGVFRDQLFLHPELDFAMDFPKGWKVQNQKTAVAGGSPQGDAMLTLEGQGASGDPRSAAQQFAQKAKLGLQDARTLKVGGLPAFGAAAVAKTQKGEVAALLTWVSHPKGMFRITGVTPVAKYREYSQTFRTAATSFRPLSAKERRSISERRLRVVKARDGETLAALSKRTKNRWSVKETAIANGVAEDARIPGGTPVKITVEVPYRPK